MVEHYTKKFNSLWQYSKTLEDLDYKDCCVFEKSFKFKVESFVRWICMEARSDVCPPPKLKEDLNILQKTNFDLCSLEEIENLFCQISSDIEYKDVNYVKIGRVIRTIFENLRQICCCYECWPDRKLFVWKESKQYCFYKKKCLNPCQFIDLL